jgi:hypothetical protein
VSQFDPLRSARALPLIIATFAFVVHPSPGLAQTDNPNVISFQPSPQHSSTLASGQPAVTGYELGFFRAGSTERVLSVDLGKPAPQSDGLIRVDYTTRITSWPLIGEDAQARVTAIGPGGTGTSTVSNTFTYNCSYRLSAAGDAVAAAGETDMIEVVAGTLCGWSASSPASWLTVTSGASGVSSGWVGYSVAANTGPATRTAALSVAGLQYTVTQAGASSESNLPPTVRIVRPSSGMSARVGPPVKISAEASDADGIAKVEFYANGALIGTVTGGQYSLQWRVPSAGTYSVTAVAEDARGARTTSEAVSVTGR